MVALQPDAVLPTIDLTQAEPGVLSREQIVCRLLDLAPGLSAERLVGFEVPALRLYMDHLSFTRAPRGRGSRWTRPGDTPAILKRDPRDEE